MIRSFISYLAYLIVILFACVIVAYIVKTWLVFNDAKVGFDLATISSIMGGFILAGAFLDSKPTDRQRRLRQIGVLYLISAMAFVVLGLSAPIIEDFIFVPYLSAISIAVGAFGFAMGSVLLSFEIRRLWSG